MHHYLSITSIGFFLLLFIACKENSADNRDDFTGNYNCRQIRYNAPAGISDTSLITVEVFAVGDSTLSIWGTEIFVNPEGRFGINSAGYCQQYVTDYRIFCGRFSQDSLYLGIHSGGIGTYTSYGIEGKIK